MELPDFYDTVAADVLDYAGVGDGVWLDVGSGADGLGLAVAARCAGAVVLLDPNAEALSQAVAQAQLRGLAGRVVALVGTAENMPLHDESVDVLISRGSFYFWQDRAQGLREVYRVLRVGGKAMIGGGLGTRYPALARREFIRRRREAASAGGPEAARRFAEDRSPETFRRLAREAGLPSFEVIGEGGLSADDPNAGIGIWLRFEKEQANAQ
ncbi:MAG TPA: class I SAM-dependent methyltransferase [Planctomycetota bacterium]|nr:class I SAM-dependent methyltransferase [Planctomycetota bacterium]